MAIFRKRWLRYLTASALLCLGQLSVVNPVLNAGLPWFRKKTCRSVECNPIIGSSSPVMTTPMQPTPKSAPAPTDPSKAPSTAATPIPQANPSSTPDRAPDLTQPNAAMNSSAADLSSSSSFASSSQSFAPNLIGDFFAGRGQRIVIPEIRPGFLNNANGNVTFNGTTLGALNANQPLSFTSPGPGVLNATLANGQPLVNVPALTSVNVDSSLPLSGLTNFNVIALNTNSGDVMMGEQQVGVVLTAVEQQLQNQAGTGATALPATATYTNGNAVALNPTNAPPGTGAPYSLVFNGFATSFVQTQNVLFIEVPSPSGGGSVGRLKIAENNSPLPRDRVFFNYNYFNSVPLTTGGLSVNTFTPGFEKTFLDGMTSIEFRAPFAGTLDSNQFAGAGSSVQNLEFGNFTIVTKALLHQTNTVAVSTGVGFALPTADDINIYRVNGPQLLKIDNKSTHIQPYVGALWTPNSRFFAQGFLQFDFDAGGNPVSSDLLGVGALVNSGKLNDQNSIFVDAAVGYWLMRDETGEQFITGIAPVAELHYNASINQSDTIALGQLLVGPQATTYDIVNLTLGTNFEIRDNTTLTAAFVTPLTQTPDRQFDYEVGLQLNHRFGAQSRAGRATTY